MKLSEARSAEALRFVLAHLRKMQEEERLDFDPDDLTKENIILKPQGANKDGTSGPDSPKFPISDEVCAKFCVLAKEELGLDLEPRDDQGLCRCVRAYFNQFQYAQVDLTVIRRKVDPGGEGTVSDQPHAEAMLMHYLQGGGSPKKFRPKKGSLTWKGKAMKPLKSKKHKNIAQCPIW